MKVMLQVTCKLPKSMLPVVVGEDGKIVAEIAKDAGTKITLLASTPQEETVLFHIVGTPGDDKQIERFPSQYSPS